jgi:hypothetical protein
LILADRLKKTLQEVEEMTAKEFDTWAVYLKMEAERIQPHGR